MIREGRKRNQGGNGTFLTHWHNCVAYPHNCTPLGCPPPTIRPAEGVILRGGCVSAFLVIGTRAGKAIRCEKSTARMDTGTAPFLVVQSSAYCSSKAKLA